MEAREGTDRLAQSAVILQGHDLDRTRHQTTGQSAIPLPNSNQKLDMMPNYLCASGPRPARTNSLTIPCHPEPVGKLPYSEMMRFWQGTVFLMQVPLRGSTLSTMTNGASSRVTMLRWSSSCSSVSGHIRGHT